MGTALPLPILHDYIARHPGMDSHYSSSRQGLPGSRTQGRESPKTVGMTIYLNTSTSAGSRAQGCESPKTANMTAYLNTCV